MKGLLRNIVIAVIATAGFTLLHAQSSAISRDAKLTGDEILQLSDLSRNGWTSYSVLTTIINYEDNELKEKGLFEVSIKGMDKTLVKFMNASSTLWSWIEASASASASQRASWRRRSPSQHHG